MVTEEAYAALQAENATLREQLAQAVQRISELEAKKTPSSAFVRANRPTVTKRERKRRAPAANQARRREPATAVERHAITSMTLPLYRLQRV